MPRKTHHVVPKADGGRDIKKGGGEKAIKHLRQKTKNKLLKAYLG